MVLNKCCFSIIIFKKSFFVILRMEIDIPGFENIEDFLGYCELHSRTERALFSGQHINCLYELAGIVPPYQIVDAGQLFDSIPYEEMEEIIDIIENKRNSTEGKFERKDSGRTPEKPKEVSGNIVCLDDYR